MNKLLVGYRNMMKLSQKTMALKLGINIVSYCYKENGQREFKEKEMNRIMDVLNVDYPILTMDKVFRKKNSPVRL
jgi:DNA-binding XRE family transcriptional regulator